MQHKNVQRHRGQNMTAGMVLPCFGRGAVDGDGINHRDP